jgi:D-xylose reductase
VPSPLKSPPDRSLQLWNTNHAPANVKSFAKYQLQLWGLDKFDLYLMHFPIALKYVPAETKFPAEWEHPDGGVQLGKVPIMIGKRGI